MYTVYTIEITVTVYLSLKPCFFLFEILLKTLPSFKDSNRVKAQIAGALFTMAKTLLSGLVVQSHKTPLHYRLYYSKYN